MSASALLQCQYPAWYARYGSLAPPSIVVPLTPDVVEQLRAACSAADEVRVPGRQAFLPPLSVATAKPGPAAQQAGAR
jgi:hypothetical protein